MDEEAIMYIAFTMVVLLIGISLLQYFGRGLIEVLCFFIIVAGVLLILILNFADFILMSVVAGLFNITFQPAQNYKITKDQNAIVKNVNGLFYATGYVTANLFAYTFKIETESADEDEKMISAPENWERAIMNIDFPLKYHVLSMGLDVQKVRDEYEGKRSYQEFQMSRALQSPTVNDMTLTEIQRKINVIQRKIDRISQGEKPIATAMYMETTAIGVSEKAALDTLNRQISGLQISMSSMDVDLTRIVGREMQVLFGFNFALPTTFEEASSYFDQQN